MCLFVETAEDPKIALKNIPIYKVVLKSSTGDNLYFSYYMKSEIKLNIEYQSELDYPQTLNFFSATKRKAVDVGLHSFKNLSDAESFLRNHSFEGRLSILIGYIPTGSRYYQGMFDVWESYASDKIFYYDVVEDSDVNLFAIKFIDYIDKL